MEENNEQYVCCGYCSEKINIGESMQYDSNYNTYCNNTECTEGVATTGTMLELDWFG